MSKTEQALILALQAKDEQMQSNCCEYFMPQWNLSQRGDKVELRQTSTKKVASFPLFDSGIVLLQASGRCDSGGLSCAILQWKKCDITIEGRKTVAEIKVERKNITLTQYHTSTSFDFPHQYHVRRLVSEFCDILRQRVKHYISQDELADFQSDVQILLAEETQ